MAWRPPAHRLDVEPYRPGPPAGWRRPVAFLTDLLVWPGIGHFALGRFGRGAFWILASAVSILAIPLVARVAPVALACAAAPRVLAAVDGALLRQRGAPGVVQLLAGVLAAAAALCGILLLAQRFYVDVFLVPSPGMAPTVLAGDRVYVNKLELRLGEIGRGDVIAFAHPCMPEERYIQRVVGVAGDAIEVRCDALHVNGAAVPRRLVDEDATYWEQGPEGWREQPVRRFAERLGGREIDVFQSAGKTTGAADFPQAERPGCGALGGEAGADRLDPGRVEESQPTGGAAAGACAPRRHYVVPDGHVFVMGDNRDGAADSRLWGAVPVGMVLGVVSGICWSAGAPADGTRWERIGPID